MCAPTMPPSAEVPCEDDCPVTQRNPAEESDAPTSLETLYAVVVRGLVKGDAQ